MEMIRKTAFNLAKKGFFGLLTLSLVFSSLAFPLPIAKAVAGVPRIIGYQGRLSDSAGTLLGSSSGTTYYFKFSIYDASTSGAKVWPSSAPSSFAATVTSGVFNVNIGDTDSGFPHLLDYNFSDNNNVYLEVGVSSDDVTFQTLEPRQLISANVFAQYAGAVSGTSTPSSFGTTTPIDFAQATFEATTTTAIPIAIRGASGQTANLFQIQEGEDGLSRVVVDSGFRLGVGTSSLGADLGLFGLGIEGAAIIGNYLNVSYINATSTTATSTFKGGINLAREAGNVGIGTSSPFALLSVAGSGFFRGGLSLGVSATTTDGHLRATLLHSDTQIVAKGLVSCDSIDTDADGVLKCGSDDSGSNTSGFTDTGTVVRLQTATDNVELADLFVLGSDINIGNGITATSTFSGSYGKLGLASTTPWGQFSIEVSGVPGSTTPVFVIGDSGTSSPIFIANVNGRIGIATNTVDQYGILGIGLSVATNTYISGGLGVGIATQTSGTIIADLNITADSFYGSGLATSSFEGGINVKGLGGLTSASGLTITGGGIQSSGKIVTTDSATSSIPNLNVATLLNGAALNLSGRLDSSFAGTSTFAGGLTANYLDSATRLRIAELTSCDTIDTDADGVLKCGADADTNTSGFTDTGTVVRLQTATDNVELADLFVLGSDINIGNGILATSTFSGSYGKLGLASTTPWGQFSIEVSGVPGSTTPVFVIGDSGTSSPIFIANVNGRIGIATNTVDQYGILGIGLSVATNTYIHGGLSVGETPTSTPGHLVATLLHSETQIVARGLIDCDTINTDAEGVLKCGADNAAGTPAGLDTQVQFNAAASFGANSGLVYGSTNLTIGGDLSLNGSDLNIGNGITATSTFSGSYGKLGLGTTSPFGQFAIEVSAVAGSNTPVFFIGDSGTSSPFLVANVN
ncbi:MAG: hypothetical protein Q7S83_00005, partial [bacterium]|nr:hypothetical protein [bacterium]